MPSMVRLSRTLRACCLLQSRVTCRRAAGALPRNRRLDQGSIRSATSGAGRCTFLAAIYGPDALPLAKTLRARQRVRPDGEASAGKIRQDMEMMGTSRPHLSLFRQISGRPDAEFERVSDAPPSERSRSGQRLSSGSNRTMSHGSHRL